MIRQFTNLIGMHLKEFFREPGILFWAILFPVLMSWGLGLAFSNKGELIRTVILVEEKNTLDQFEAWKNIAGSDFTMESRLGDEKSGFTLYKFEKQNWEEAILKLKRGESSLVLEAGTDSIIYHFDPLNSEAQLAYLQLSNAMNKNDNIVGQATISPLTTVGTRYIDFLIPGLVAFGIMMSCTWGIGYNLIDKRMKKLLRRMVATPMKKSLFLLSMFVSRMLLNFMEALVLIVFAYFFFDVKIQGNWLALILMLIVGSLAFSGIGMLVSSRTSNTQVGNGLINLVVMPMMILSGIFFSYHNFPEWAEQVIRFFPLTILADTIRSIFIEGAGLAESLTGFLILAGVFLFTFLGALRIYKWY